jgi:hypothetical protein
LVVLSSGCRPGDRSASCKSIHEIRRESVVNREAMRFSFFDGEESAFHAECVRARSERAARTDRKRVNDRCLGAGERCKCVCKWRSTVEDVRSVTEETLRMARARRVAVGETELRRRASEARPWETVHETLCEDARRLLRVSDSRTRRVQRAGDQKKTARGASSSGVQSPSDLDAVGLSA